MRISTMDEINFYTTRMQGYLSALSRLTKDRVSFGTRSFLIDGDLEKAIVSDIKNNNGSIISQTKIDHIKAAELLKNNVYSQFSNFSEDQIGLLDWDIQEYFGLISTALNSEFHPLISNGGYHLEIEMEGTQKVTSLLVVIQNYGILISVYKYA